MGGLRPSASCRKHALMDELQDVIALVSRVRDHYVQQFGAFASGQRQTCARGAPEVMFQLSEDSGLFQRLYRVDFVRNDEVVEPVEFQPEYVLTFDQISTGFASATLSISQLRWDDVVIGHDVSSLFDGELSQWFRLWFDPDDERHDPDAALSETVHSFSVQPSVLNVDFGTAPPGAFWELMALLEAAGATAIRISSSPVEALP